MASALCKGDVEGKARRREADRGKALASSSTLNRLELTPAEADRRSRYKKWEGEAPAELSHEWEGERTREPQS